MSSLLVCTIKTNRELRVDWDEDLSKSKKVEAPKVVSAVKPAPAPAATPAASSTTVVVAPKPATSSVKDTMPAETFKADLKPLTVDEELERRKARAAKWGTEVKEPVVAKPAPTTSTKPAKPTKIVPATPATDVSVDVFRNGVSLIPHMFAGCRKDSSKTSPFWVSQGINQIHHCDGSGRG
jgi:hypothetical protein